MHSLESNEYSESSENFSEELCKKTKKKTPIKKINADPTNKLAKKGRKRATDKDEKSDADTVVKTTANKAKKNIKPRKKSIDKSEKAEKGMVQCFAVVWVHSS